MVPKIETLTTTVPMRFAPRDASASFRDGKRKWTVTMIDPVHWPHPQRSVDVLWQIVPTKKATGQILGWFRVVIDGVDVEAQFEVLAINGRAALNHLEMFCLHHQAEIPSIAIPTAKLVLAAKTVGHVVGEAEKRRGRWVNVRLGEFSDPSGDVAKRLPMMHPTQIERTFWAYTTAPANKRVQAVMDQTGFGEDAANKMIATMKKDPKWKHEFARWEKGQNK